MKRIASLAVLMVLAFSLARITAQNYKTKEKEKPRAEAQDTVAQDAVIVSGNDDASALTKDSSTNIHYFLFPEFYAYWPVDNNDTILKYECFDANHSAIVMDTLTNANDIRYITAVKTYNDYLKTYIDAEGKPRPQPVARVLFTFERTGNNSWKSVDVATGYGISLQEHKDEIVRRDTTTVADPLTGDKQLTIREYYKVTEVEGSGTTVSKPVNSENTTEVFYYTVPDFYFHVPKMSKDTTYVFECYDDRDSVIYDVTDYDNVHYFALLRKFTDSAHTYRDDDGRQKPLPVSDIAIRYDKKGKNKWISVEYPGNRFTDMKAFKDNIVSIDTEVLTDPLSDHTQMKIFRHYKVIKN